MALVRGELPLATISYRAPEIILASQAFGPPVDMWAFGLVVLEACGADFHKPPPGQERWVGLDVWQALVFQLGSPVGAAAAALATMPSWSDVELLQPSGAAPWPSQARKLLGSAGLELVEALLQWDPRLRPPATAVRSSAFLASDGLVLAGAAEGGDLCLRGQPSWRGARHDWNILSGSLSMEVLQWLRSEPALQPGTEEWAGLGLDFKASTARVKTEFGRKFIMAGSLGSSCGTSAMCNLSLSEPLPLGRFQAWFRAFRELNKDALGQRFPRKGLLDHRRHLCM